MSELLISDRDGIRVLTLNRPDKRNALNVELIDSLKTALTSAESDESVKAVIICGAGRDFCSGADLTSIQKIANATYEENLADANSLGELFKSIRRARMPVIAAVQGRALAGGCGLALACDIVLADNTGVFGFPEVKIGFVPAMVAAIVRRNMLEKTAFAWLTTGYEMTAAELKDNGLIHGIFDEEKFDEEVIDFASAYLKVSRSAVEMTKRLFYDVDGVEFSDAIDRGAQVNAKARMTDDCKAGIAKFLDRRG